MNAAAAPAAGWGGAASLLELGGPVIAVLVVMSVIAQVIVILKLWQFYSVRINARRFIDLSLFHWRQGRHAPALGALAGVKNPIAGVMRTAMEGITDESLSMATVREEVGRVALAQLESLRSNLRGLEIIGNLSPLLGLLGTVLGMIEAFRQIEAAGTRMDPGVLSGGIWQALLTTAVGLVVAIPTIAALHWLEAWIDRLRHRMEDAVTLVFTHGAVHYPEEPPPVPAREAYGYRGSD